MKQNSFPVIIDSPGINFAIIGPQEGQDGILMKSKDNDIDLVGISSMIYYNTESKNNPKGFLSATGQLSLE